MTTFIQNIAKSLTFIFKKIGWWGVTPQNLITFGPFVSSIVVILGNFLDFVIFTFVSQYFQVCFLGVHPPTHIPAYASENILNKIFCWNIFGFCQWCLRSPKSLNHLHSTYGKIMNNYGLPLSLMKLWRKKIWAVDMLLYTGSACIHIKLVQWFTLFNLLRNLADILSSCWPWRSSLV